jgi:hypothetical protein
MFKSWLEKSILICILAANVLLSWTILKIKIEEINQNTAQKIEETRRSLFLYMIENSYGTFVIKAEGENLEAAIAELKNMINVSKQNKWSLIGNKKITKKIDGSIELFQTIYRLPD